MLHPRFASATRCLPSRHTQPTQLATRRGRTRLAPIPESACGSRSHCRSAPRAVLSTGSLCAARTRSPRIQHAARSVCAHPRAGVDICVCSDVRAAAAPAAPPSARMRPILPKRPGWPWPIAFSEARSDASTGKQCSILFTDKLLVNEDAFPPTGRVERRGNFRHLYCETAAQQRAEDKPPVPRVWHHACDPRQLSSTCVPPTIAESPRGTLTRVAKISS